MPAKIINNKRPDDTNITRNKKPVELPKFSILPEGFVTTSAELEVLKWALQFYIYQEKNQKLSGKVFLNEITETKKHIATYLLQKIG